MATNWRSGSIPRARPARPKGVRHVHASLKATADTFGRAGARHPRGRRGVFGGQDVLRLRARQRDVVSDVVGATTVICSAAGRRRRRCSRSWPSERPTIFCGVPTLFAALVAEQEKRGGAPEHAHAHLHLRRRGAAARDRRTLGAALGRRDHRRRRLDRDAAHLPVERARRHRLRHLRHAGAGLRGAAGRRA